MHNIDSNGAYNEFMDFPLLFDGKRMRVKFINYSLFCVISTLGTKL